MSIQNIIHISIITIVMTMVCGICYADNKTDQAIDTAKTWLNFVDTKEYKTNWIEATPFFKDKVSEKDWEKMISSVRDPLGKVKSRKLLKTQYTTTLPEAPKGEYVVIQFKTHFTNKSDAIETITPMKDDKGIWRVSGYFIR